MRPRRASRRLWILCSVLWIVAAPLNVLAQRTCGESGAEAVSLSEKEMLQRAKKRVQPAVPGGLGRIDADVEVFVVVGNDGKVVCAEACKPSHPILRKYCADAARQWIFRPMKKNGRPIEFAGPVRFRIKR